MTDPDQKSRQGKSAGAEPTGSGGDGVLSHLDARGHARMVDVGGKLASGRRAVAEARVRVLPSTIRAIAGGETPKGDVLAVARVAGIMAAKKTAELIPLCHALAIDSVGVDFDLPQVEGEGGTVAQPVDLVVNATVSLQGKTGVEMEALTGVTVAALTVYDMCKGIDKQMVIHGVRLLEKTK